MAPSPPRFQRRLTSAAVLFALPGVLLAIAGATHPRHLTYATSAHWTSMHIVAIFIFPLVGVALMGLVRGRRDPAALLVFVTAYVYATSYTALDVINGSGAGYITHRLGPGVPRPPEVRYLFELGAPLELIGAGGLFVAGVAVAIDAVVRYGRSATIPAVLMTVANISFFTSHIFWFRGAATILVIGIATGWLAFLRERARDTEPAKPGVS